MTLKEITATVATIHPHPILAAREEGCELKLAQQLEVISWLRGIKDILKPVVASYGGVGILGRRLNLNVVLLRELLKPIELKVWEKPPKAIPAPPPEPQPEAPEGDLAEAWKRACVGSDRPAQEAIIAIMIDRQARLWERARLHHEAVAKALKNHAIPLELTPLPAPNLTRRNGH